MPGYYVERKDGWNFESWDKKPEGALTPEEWNRRHNPQAPAEAAAGQTHWGTIGAIVAALMIGTAVLMASMVYSFQRYFEYQIEEARKISQ